MNNEIEDAVIIDEDGNELQQHEQQFMYEADVNVTNESLKEIITKLVNGYSNNLPAIMQGEGDFTDEQRFDILMNVYLELKTMVTLQPIATNLVDVFESRVFKFVEKEAESPDIVEESEDDAE